MIKELRRADPISVGPYRLVGRLGTGGMGQVFLAKSPGGRLVAIKLIRPELAEERGFRARFASEIAAARNVSGMYTAGVIDADPEAELPWMATAYVAGPSLADAVEDDGPLPVKSVLALAAGLAEALAAIHQVGVVHRDLKPSNVLLAADGPRVIDFGISRALERSMLTTTGVVMGSPGFMSPEQARGQREIGPPTDVFSLGAVLAFAATGDGPFGGGPTPALLYRVVNEEPDLTQVPARLRPLIERCLAKDPDDRPTPAELLTMLSGDIGVLTGDWLPAAIADTMGRYVPTIATPTPPPPAPEAAGIEATPLALAEPVMAEPVMAESATTGPAAAELAAPAPAAADEATADEAAADEALDATRDIHIPASAATMAGASAETPASPTALIKSRQAGAGLPGPARAVAPAAAVVAAAVAGNAAAGNAAAAATAPGGPTPPRAATVSPLRRWRWPIGAAAAAAIIVAVVATVLALAPGSTPRTTSGPTPSLARITTRPAAPHTTTARPSKTPTKTKTTKPAAKPTKKKPTKKSSRPTPAAQTSPTPGFTASPTPTVTQQQQPPPATTSQAAPPPAPKTTAPKSAPPKTTPPASGVQVIAGYSGASAQGCAVYGSIGSASGGAGVGYSFTNNSGADIQVWYLTAGGSGDPEGTVAPGHSFSPAVSTGQDWMVTNSGGGCLDIFTISGGGGVTVGS